MSKDADKQGVDVEAMKQPLTQEIVDEAKQKLGLATTLLLSPPGQHGRSGDKAFYANFLMRMNTTYTNDLPTAGVSVTDKINLYCNPHFILSLSINKVIELLIHEIEHIVYLHPLRSKALEDSCGDKNKHKLYNIAADANINVPLTDLTEDLGVTIERLNEQLKEYGSDTRLSEQDAAEVHYYKLRQFQEEMGDKLPQGFGEGGGGACDDHSTWDESIENEELAKEIIKEASNKAAQATGIGNCPSHIIKQLEELNKSLVNWKRELAQFFVRTLKFNRERTRSKRNRRTGIVNPGSRKEPKVKIAFIGDESGSMDDEQVAQVYAEVAKVADMGIEVLYVPMDSEAGEVVKFKKGMRLQRTRSGGTYYQPPLDVAEKLGVDAVVFLGDFDCADKPRKPKFPVLWIGINTNSPAPGGFGKAIYVETKK